jgi:hypothetical protein
MRANALRSDRGSFGTGLDEKSPACLRLLYRLLAALRAKVAGFEAPTGHISYQRRDGMLEFLATPAQARAVTVLVSARFISHQLRG